MSAHFTYDDEAHVYRLADGKRVESVTEVLQDNRLLPDYTWLDPYYSERGKAVHKGMALLARGELDWNSVDEHTKTHLERGERILDLLAMRQDDLSIEFPWVHTELHYGGTWDLFGFSGLLGRYLVVDWKAGAVEPGHHLQVAGGYLQLIENAALRGGLTDFGGKRFAKVFSSCSAFVVSLGGNELPKLQPVDELEQWDQAFNAALSTTRWRRQHLKTGRTN